MAARKPLVVIGGQVQELSQFDTVDVPTQSPESRSNRPASTEFVHNVIGGLYSVTTTGGTTVVSETSAVNLSITVLGALTSNAILEIPSTARRIYSVANETTGPYTVAIRQGTGEALVTQGRRALIRVNGFGAAVAVTDFPSIALTGVPTAPTASAGTDTAQIANMAALQAGVASARDRAIHTGTQSIGTVTGLQAALDSKVVAVAGKVLSSNDFTNDERVKLANVAAEATKNATDAALRDRSTHTGVQAMSTVTGLDVALAARLLLDHLGRSPAQVPANQFIARAAFEDDISVLMPRANQPVEPGAIWFEKTSNTSILLCMRGDDGVVRSISLTLS